MFNTQFQEHLTQSNPILFNPRMGYKIDGILNTHMIDQLWEKKQFYSAPLHLFMNHDFRFKKIHIQANEFEEENLS